MQKRIALVVGMANYKHYNRLEYAVPSAEDVYQLLISPEFGRCDPNKSVLITDKDNPSFTTFDLDQKIAHVLENISVGDQFLFYFCGHAKVYKNQLYLLLPNTKKDNWLGAYYFSSLVQKLDIQNIKKIILVVDACHSAAMFNSIKDFQSDWEPDTLPKGVGFMAACGEIQRARQESLLQRTLFSHYLCDGVKQWADSSSRYITLPKLRTHINDQIEKNHPDAEQKAHTWIREGDKDLWFFLNPHYSSNEPKNSVGEQYSLADLEALNDNELHLLAFHYCQPIYKQLDKNPPRNEVINGLYTHLKQFEKIEGLTQNNIGEVVKSIMADNNLSHDKKVQMIKAVFISNSMLKTN